MSSMVCPFDSLASRVNFGPARANFRTWLDNRYGTFLTDLGFSWEYTPDLHSDFAINGSDSSQNQVNLLVINRARVDTIVGSRQFQLLARTSPDGGDWLIAVGTDPVLSHGSPDTSLERGWQWYRDISGVAVSGAGLRSGELMSVAKCPVCASVAWVPLDGWQRFPLHTCGHREPEQELLMVGRFGERCYRAMLKTPGPTAWRKIQSRPKPSEVTRDLNPVERVEELGRRLRRERRKSISGLFVSQTHLGNALDMDVLAVGRILFDFELREDRTVTPDARDMGYVIEVEYPGGKTGFAWHKRRCIELIEQAGLGRYQRDGHIVAARGDHYRTRGLIKLNRAALVDIGDQWEAKYREKAESAIDAIASSVLADPVDSQYVLEWRRLTRMPIDEIERTVLDPGEYGDGLRRTSPLIGL
ncbi:hypothetical protein ACIBM3_15450 [Rhodococcus erythropolis]|uniref:hypothetical protein n=1 Tax=Rhodococcus erythropolis TaxID=1833 RepID=UPI0037B7863A